jgi:PHD/YefM family antitoxin component YafN of YafNO toxin-antitoxin module
MNVIAANDLKTQGIGAVAAALAKHPEAALTVRGEPQYVVMSTAEYQRLRECELEAALAESQADLKAGRFVKETVDQHLKRLKALRKSVG